MQQVYKQSDKIFNALRTFVNILKRDKNGYYRYICVYNNKKWQIQIKKIAMHVQKKFKV